MWSRMSIVMVERLRGGMVHVNRLYKSIVNRSRRRSRLLLLLLVLQLALSSLVILMRSLILWKTRESKALGRVNTT